MIKLIKFESYEKATEYTFQNTLEDEVKIYKGEKTISIETDGMNLEDVLQAVELVKKGEFKLC